MMRYFKNKWDAVQFAKEQVAGFEYPWQLTMTITPGKFEGCSVLSAIIDLSEDTDPLMDSGFSETQVST